MYVIDIINVSVCIVIYDIAFLFDKPTYLDMDEKAKPLQNIFLQKI
jgi:hypothetical protein